VTITLNTALDQVRRQFRQAIILSVRPTKFERDVLALDIASFTQSSMKGGEHGHIGLARSSAEIADHRHRRLLRPRRQRPRGRSSAEQRDELAPLHVWMAPAWQENFGRAAQRSLAVMCPAC
jgi:hypothetical protein